MTPKFMIQSVRKIFLVIVLVGFGGFMTQASGGDREQKISDIIIHHIQDTHDWHFFDIGEVEVALHLPWLLYNTEEGIQFFGSTYALEKEPNYLVHHDRVYHVNSKDPVAEFKIEKGSHDAESMMEEVHRFEKNGDFVVTHETFIERHGEEKIEVVEYKAFDKKEGAILDLSLTKTGIQIFLVCVLMFFIFTSVAKGYQKNEGKAPKGIQSFFEPIILFVREDVAKPFLHGKHDRFMPYLLTLFFFIWISNMVGLMPINSNIAGNTSITLMLATLSFVLILANSTMDFWGHIFWFPGVPLALKPLMLIVEFMGLLTKPAALAIRLFANISAGHFMVLALISLIFILGDMGHSQAGAWGVTPLTILFGIFIFAVELIVAVVQAFVFAMLTAVFIGQAMETHGHGDHH